MIISDLEILEVVETANVQGGIVDRAYNQNDNVNVTFRSTNFFQTIVVDPERADINSAAAGAKGDAQNNSARLFGLPVIPTYSFTKADTIAATALFDGSFSQSSSAAVINRI